MVTQPAAAGGAGALSLITPRTTCLWVGELLRSVGSLAMLAFLAGDIGWPGGAEEGRMR